MPTMIDQSAWWAALDELPTPVAFIGTDRRYQYVNRAYEQWAMRRRGDVVGHTITELLGKAAESVISAYAEAALAGATIQFESSIPFQRIGVRRMRSTYTAAKGPDGQVVGFFAFLNDVTDQHDAEAAIAAALDGIADGFLSINSSYCFTYVNSGAARFYGLSREEMVGRRIDDLFPGSMDSPAGRMLTEVMQTRAPQRRELPSAGNPGRRFLMDIVPTRTGGVGVVIQDTTDTPRRGEGVQLPDGFMAIRQPGGRGEAGAAS